MNGFLGGGIGPTAIARRSGLAAPVPVAGAELWINGSAVDGNADGTADDWVILGTPSIVSGNGFSGNAQRVVQAGTYWDIQNFTKTRHAWYILAAQYRSNVTFSVRDGINTYFSYAANTGNALPMLTTWRQLSAGLTGLFTGNGVNGVAYSEVGSVSVKPLTLSSLISTRAYATADCDLSVAVTRTAGTQAGLVARLDSATSPANFLIAYLDGAGNVKVDKCVAGTYTNVITGAVAYAAGRVLRLVCSGNNVSAYYHGTQVGTTQTVSDAGIASNTRHGLFSTYAANTFSGYVAA